ncbi:MAG: NAD-dependent epimerase [Gemmatimonadota bacterium]
MRYLVTGSAGFIGFHVCRRLLQSGVGVTGLDSVNDYYDPALKEARLATLEQAAASAGADYEFRRADIVDRCAVDACFRESAFDRVIHLAAQPGVRYSLVNPRAYVESNIVGFTNILEACRESGTAHLVYASSSSVYGARGSQPYSEHQGADHPLQLYAATKRANELMAHSYSHLFRLPTTGLRFFTVYGPWGRPDMAMFTFTRSILEGTPLQLFNNGCHSRDFTYIDDIIEGVLRVAECIPSPDPDWDPRDPDPASSSAPFRILNIGSHRPVNLADYVDAIEEAVGKKALREPAPMQPGDVLSTWADVTDLERLTGYRPATPVREGVRRFVSWYRSYYKV